MEIAVDRKMLQYALCKLEGIIEAFAMVRKNESDKEILVIYAVPETLSLKTATSFTLSNFIAEFHLDDSLPVCFKGVSFDEKHQPLAQFVLLNALPRNKDGSVNEAALTEMAVIDTGLMENWSAAIQAVAGIEKFAVLDVLARSEAKYFHRQDIIREVEPGVQQVKLAENSIPVKESSSNKNLSLKPGARAEVHATGQIFTDRLDDNYSLSLASALYRAAKISQDKGIHYIDEKGGSSFQSYPELLQSAKIMLSGLHASGLNAGDKVLLQCADNENFLTVFWACVLGSMVPVPVSIAPNYTIDNAVVQKLLNVWQLLEQPVVVCSDNLHADIESLCSDTSLRAEYVLPVQRLLHRAAAPEAAAENEHIVKQPCADDLALLLLTSGSTGTPKAVMHTHRTLINRSAATSSFNDFTRDDVSLNWMPLDHVGGIVMFHLRDVYNACSQLQVATAWVLEQPLRWLDTIDSYRASITWAPNFAYALIVEQAVEINNRNWDLSSMRFLLNGGEAVVARTASSFLQLLEQYKLPADSMHPAWGMSETASGVCYSHNFSVRTATEFDGAVEVGGPIPNTSLRIVGADNQVLSEGEKGNLQIKGASVTPGYYMNPEANQQAFTDDGWFITGDAGVLNEGRLTITARVKDEIIINGINFPAAEIESIAESVPGVEVSFTAACAVRRAGSNTDALAVFFCPAEDAKNSLASLLWAIQEAVSSNAGIKPEFLIPLSASQIPKTNIGKIQRTILRQSFEQGEFDEQLKQSETMFGINVIPGWFYRKNWIAKTLLTANQEASGLPDSDDQFLVFCDSSGFGTAFCEKLIDSGIRTVSVMIADAYQRLDESSYTIDPSSAAEYSQLMQALQDAGFHPDVIVHCWTYAQVKDSLLLDDFKTANLHGIYSLLNIVQSLDNAGRAEKQVKLFVASGDVQQCMRKHKFINPHASIMGLLKTVPHELDWLTARHIDFSFYNSGKELAEQVDALFDEVLSCAHDDEIVYRHGQRFGWQLLPETFSEQGFSASPLKPGGIVLITGGLGGVGGYLAKFLLTQFKSRLLLVGRSELPAREHWDQLIQAEGKLSERIAQYLEIEAAGGEFIYAVADVSDPEVMQSVVSDAEQRWNDELNGVFHLAVGGNAGSHTIAEESIASCEQMFAAKVYGSLCLANLVSKRKNTFLVAFASVIGVFGEANYSSYAAAHTFLGQLTHYYSHRMPGRFYQFDWSAWDNIPAYAIDYFRSIGYSLITEQLGMDCLLAGLCRQQEELVIGLDSDKWPVRKHLEFESSPLLKLVTCYATADQGVDIESSLKGRNVTDMFNVASQCEFMQLDQLPLTENGKPDIRALHLMIDSNSEQQDAKPVTDMEKQIAACWCDVLNIEQPGVNTGFFQLGGNSLLATQLISRLKQALDVSLNMRDLFNAATISEMAVLVENRQAENRQTKQQAEVADDYDLALPSTEELLANIDQLSEEQVASLLTRMQQEGEA